MEKSWKINVEKERAPCVYDAVARRWTVNKQNLVQVLHRLHSSTSVIDSVESKLLQCIRRIPFYTLLRLSLRNETGDDVKWPQSN